MALAGLEGVEHAGDALHRVQQIVVARPVPVLAGIGVGLVGVVLVTIVLAYIIKPISDRGLRIERDLKALEKAHADRLVELRQDQEGRMTALRDDQQSRLDDLRMK